jgi:cysteine desulfurase/selenocysteine lyase
MVGHGKVDLKDLGVDFMAFSGHKCLAPTGSAALYIAPGIAIDSAFVGGGTISDASVHDYSLLPVPEGMEAGTPNIAGFIGLGAALDYMASLGLENIHAQESKVVKKIVDGRAALGADVYGPRNIEEKASAVSFNIPGMDAHQVALMADEMARICIRSGHHCAIPVSKMLGIKASARASVQAFNTEKEAETLLEAVSKMRLLV